MNDDDLHTRKALTHVVVDQLQQQTDVCNGLLRRRFVGGAPGIRRILQGPENEAAADQVNNLDDNETEQYSAPHSE